MQPRKAKPESKLAVELEAHARLWVNSWIQSGFTTADMKDRAVELTCHFQSFLTRDIRTFGETGKYPQYVDAQEVK